LLQTPIEIPSPPTPRTLAAIKGEPETGVESVVDRFITQAESLEYMADVIEACGVIRSGNIALINWHLSQEPEEEDKE